MNRTIKLNGINRNTSITNNADGNCEDVLNLRPRSGRYESVGAKKPDISSNGAKGINENWLYNLHTRTMDSRRIVKYYQHKIGESINHIFIVSIRRPSTALMSDALECVWVKDPTSSDGFNTDNCQSLWEIDIKRESLSVDNGLSIDIASTGNFICFNLPKVTTFLFQEGEYKETKQQVVDAPTIDYDINSKFSDKGNELTFSGKITLGQYSAARTYLLNRMSEYYYIGTRFLNKRYLINDELLCDNPVNTYHCPIDYCNNRIPVSMTNEMRETLAGEYENMTKALDDYREGYVLVCSAYELFDGSFVNYSVPKLIHLGTSGIDSTADDVTTDIDKIDSLFNPDKFQIIRYQAGDIGPAEHSEGTELNCNIKGFIRRQNLQRLIFKRPTDIPEDLGKEYSKIVYFVSEPISMYDFDKIDASYLHINLKAVLLKGRLENIDRIPSQCTYSLTEEPTFYSYASYVRVNISNPMNFAGGGNSSSDYATTPKEESYNEALVMHVPTKSEISEALMYKAVEFDIEDSSDIGTEYDSGVTGKAVNFATLSSGDLAQAEEQSSSTYDAEGLMMFNRRLHIYGITQYFRENILKKSETKTPFVYYDLYNKRLEYNPIPFSGGEYSDLYLVPANKKDLTTLPNYNIHHAIFNLEIDYISYKYVEEGSNIGSLEQNPLVVFPDARLKSVDFYIKSGSRYYKYTIEAFSSNTYNYGIVSFFNETANLSFKYVDSVEKKTVTEEEFLKYEGSYGTWITESSVKEGSRMKVSELSNPIVFPAELDYSFDDEIVALGNNHKEISLAQEGQYPTYVFTKKGIWAMGLGSSTFYATQVPINPDIAVSRFTVGVGGGVVYIARDGIKILEGRNSICISKPLETSSLTDSSFITTSSDTRLLLNTSLNSAISQAKLNFIKQDCYDYGVPVVNSAQSLYNKNCAIGFDRSRNELLFCLAIEESYHLTSVYSLDEKAWYTREERFLSFYRDYGVICEYFKMHRNTQSTNTFIEGGVVSLIEETGTHEIKVEKSASIRTPVEVFLITKPLSLGNLGFKQLYRIALRGELLLPNDYILGNDYHNEEGPHFGFYVFGSNDGGTWKMVGGKVFQESTTQVVLERIKQSYRYVAFMFAGEVYETASIFNVTHIDLDGIDKYNTRQR